MQLQIVVVCVARHRLQLWIVVFIECCVVAATLLAVVPYP